MTEVSTEDRVKLKALATQDVDYHKRQFVQPYRSTVHLARFMHSVLDQPKGRAVDVACGAGANIFHLSREFPGLQWTGADLAGDVLFDIGRERFSAAGLKVDLKQVDFFNLTGTFPRAHFDVVTFIQTILLTPRHEEALEQLLAITRGWLFISGLFTDFEVEATVMVKDYTWPEEVQGPFYYNVYSLSRIRAFCEAHGARQFVTRDFDIDIDLPKPQTRGLTTYTETLADKRRLQFTGPLLQPWKFLAIQMGEL